MTSTKYGLGQLICGTGGALLIVSLFLPWARRAAGDLSGWQLWTMADVFLLIVGLVAIGMALTGGRIGLFRPDLSLSGAADLLGLVATVLLTWLVIFDFPEGASREIGVFVALMGAMAVAGGAGDYAPLRGARWFQRHRSPVRERSNGDDSPRLLSAQSDHADTEQASYRLRSKSDTEPATGTPAGLPLSQNAVAPRRAV